MALFTSPIPEYAAGGRTRSSLHAHATSSLSLTLLSLEWSKPTRGSMRSWTVAPCEPRKQPIEYEREANPMRKIIVSEFVSLDGVMEDPGGAEGFKYGGWTFEISRGAEGDDFKLQETRSSEALLLGRKTYEGFAAAWPTREGEFADLFNAMPKYVVSTTLDNPEWANTT